MPDADPGAEVPEPVADRIDRIHRALAGLQSVIRKPPTITASLYEIDTWAHSTELEALEAALADVGLRGYRPARTRGHHQFMSVSDGFWVKVDVKVTDPPSDGLARDLLWLLRRRRGLVVALLGADGSGKSTTSACIQTKMPIDTMGMYLGASRRSGSPGGDEEGPRGRARPGRLRQAAGLAKWAVRVAGQAAKLEVAARRGTIVVCDRHAIESGVVGDEPPAVKAVKRFIVRALPRPDTVILLSAPGDVLHGRKGEHDPETLDTMTRAWRGVCEEIGGLEIDATDSLERVCAAAQSHIWDVIGDRRS